MKFDEDVLKIWVKVIVNLGQKYEGDIRYIIFHVIF